jgi:2-keto-4-pentenoate hydratase
VSGDHDPRVVRGTRALLELQRRSVAAGAGRLGWKAAFGSPSGLEALGLDRPLVGFLTHDRRLAPGATAPVEGWARPMFEAEIAVHVAHDLPVAPSRSAVEDAVAGLSVAIELADLDPPPVDVVEILEGNIFHRHVVLGEVVQRWRELEGVVVTVSRDGEEVARTGDPQALTGRWVDVVTSMAGTLAQEGERLLAGDVVITGAVVPPLEVAAGDRMTVDVSGLGHIELTIG